MRNCFHGHDTEGGADTRHWHAPHFYIAIQFYHIPLLKKDKEHVTLQHRVSNLSIVTSMTFQWYSHIQTVTQVSNITQSPRLSSSGCLSHYAVVHENSDVLASPTF
jgi:hypothetical protein